MRPRAEFWKRAVWHGWRRMITVQDHLGVAIPLILFGLIMAGVGVVLAPVWLVPAAISVCMAALVLDGAYEEWAEERRSGGGPISPKDAVGLLAKQSVVLNGHHTNYAEVLRLVWQKLTQGATESVVEYALFAAFPLPEGEEKRYHLVAVPDLDFFFGQMRLMEALEIVTIRVPPSPYRSYSAMSRSDVQEVVGPTDEQRYTLTPFGRRMVALLANSPDPDKSGSPS